MEKEIPNRSATSNAWALRKKDSKLYPKRTLVAIKLEENPIIVNS